MDAMGKFQIKIHSARRSNATLSFVLYIWANGCDFVVLQVRSSVATQWFRAERYWNLGSLYPTLTQR